VVFGRRASVFATSLVLHGECKYVHGALGLLTPWGRRQRTLRILVVAQLTLAVVLLVLAGLLIRSFAQIAQVPPGFNANGVLTLELTLNGRKYPDIEKILQSAPHLPHHLPHPPPPPPP